MKGRWRDGRGLYIGQKKTGRGYQPMSFGVKLRKEEEKTGKNARQKRRKGKEKGKTERKTEKISKRVK